MQQGDLCQAELASTVPLAQEVGQSSSLEVFQSRGDAALRAVVGLGWMILAAFSNLHSCMMFARCWDLGLDLGLGGGTRVPYVEWLHNGFVVFFFP